MDARAGILDTVSFRAWPAAEIERLDGWILRYTSGVSRRANSVWPNEWEGRTQPEARIARAEDFYRARAARTTFQIGPNARPTDLDLLLERRGYVIGAPTSVLAAPAETVYARTRGLAAGASTVSDELTDAWFDISGRRGRYAAQESVYLALLRRITAPSGYALVILDGEPAAVGLGVCDPPWMGIFSMCTLPAFRRRGAASAILHALADWALDEGATQLYLQVERDNDAAGTLYRGAGFTQAYEYHYRLSRGEKT